MILFMWGRLETAHSSFLHCPGQTLMVLRDSRCSLPHPDCRPHAPSSLGSPYSPHSPLSKGQQAPSSFYHRQRGHYSCHIPQVPPNGLSHKLREQQWYRVASAAWQGALAAGSCHIPPARHSLGAGLRCVSPTFPWQARRTLWFTGGNVRVSSKNKLRREELMRATEKEAHTFSGWLNNNQFPRLFRRSPRWMFSLGWSLLKISCKSFISVHVVFNTCPLNLVYSSSRQRGTCVFLLSTLCSTLCSWPQLTASEQCWVTAQVRCWS